MLIVMLMPSVLYNIYAHTSIIFVSDADAYADCDADAQCVYAHISRIFVSDSDAYADCDFCI